MKMIQGTGTISNYNSYTNNCVRNQMPYKIPVPSLAAVQLYIAIGATKPDAAQYQLIHTCGALGGTIEALATSSYVIGQDTNENWYGVFKAFTGATPVCFVIAITLTTGGNDVIYFSDEYCIETSCNPLTLLKGCYGNLDNKISYNRQGIYFGTTDADDAMGDLSIVYKHELYLREVEVSYSAIKMVFKQGRTRNFRTEQTDLLQFYGDFLPEWYMPELAAIFARGEVYIGGTKYLVNETDFTKIEDCKRMWKPSATLRESYYQSFSCELDPCAAAVEECCDPASVSADVVWSDNTLTCCDPESIDVLVEYESGE